MFRPMHLGVTGMVNHQSRLNVVGNNLSNVNTNGFKADKANFQDALYQSAGSPAKSYQVGSGVNVSGMSTDFNQGAIQATGRNLDLAISGEGFFGVKSTEGDENGETKYTRSGNFYLDKEGNLVNSNGLSVVNSEGDAIQLELGDNQSAKAVEISEDGKIYINGEEQDEQIGLFKFPNPTSMTKEGGNLFLENNNTGERISNSDDAEGFGSIKSGFLEGSNIDLAKQMSELISTQRGFQASSKVFTTGDQVLSEIIDLKR